MKSSAVKSRLTAAWKQVLNQSEYQVPDPELDQFVHSSIVSLRYAVVTQLLENGTIPRGTCCVCRKAMLQVRPRPGAGIPEASVRRSWCRGYRRTTMFWVLVPILM